MAVSVLVKLFDSIVVGFTRSIADHFNPHEAEFDSESFGYSSLESTGLLWYCLPVEAHLPRIQRQTSHKYKVHDGS